MKTLLLAIKAKVIADFTDLGDCEIVADENILPVAARFPFIGLKDGEIERVYGIDQSISRSKKVWIIAYQKILKPEASIVGMITGEEGHEVVTPGVLDLIESIHTLLDGNLLNLPGIIDAYCRSESPSETVFQEMAGLLQKKKILYTYEEKP